MPIPQDLGGEGHLDAAVPGRPDVLQNAGTAVDAGQLPVHEKVARRRAIDVDGARDAATPRGEFEPDICLGRPLPRQRAVDKAARTVPDRRLVAKRVDGPGERPLGLIGIDRGVPRSPMADPQLQVGKEPRLLDEAFLGEAPGDRGRGKYLTLVSRRQARGAVVAAGEREEVAVLERVVEARHEGGQGPLRHVARGRVDPRRRPQVEVLVLLVRQPDHGRDLIFSPLRLEAVHECSVDAMSHAQAALVGQDVIERVGERALLLQVRVGGAALLRLSLGAPELPATKERQVRPEVHPPIERGAQVVIGEQGPERARAGPVVLLVRDVGERVDALPVGRGLEQQVARAVVGHPQRVIPECFTVHAVAAAQVLVALDHRGRGADAQTGIGAMVEVEPHRPTHEVHPFDDAPLIELAPTEREAGLLVTACNPHLVAQLRPRMQHEVLPVRPAPGGERLEVLGPEENRVAVRAGGDARGALVPRVAVSRGVALELGPLRAVHHRHAAHRLLRPGIGVVRNARLPGLALLRGDEHHAARAARTVDRRGRGVLQDLDRLDVVRVQVADPAGHRDSVQHVERIVGRRERARAADADADAVPGVVAAGDDIDAGHAPLDRLDGVGLGYRLHIFARYRGHRPGHVSAGLRSVAHHHDFRERDGQWCEPEVRPGGVPGGDDDVRHLHQGVPDEPRAQAVRPRWHRRDGVAAVGGGIGAELRARHRHPGARQRCARLLGRDEAGDRPGRRPLRRVLAPASGLT